MPDKWDNVDDLVLLDGRFRASDLLLRNKRREVGHSRRLLRTRVRSLRRLSIVRRNSLLVLLLRRATDNAGEGGAQEFGRSHGLLGLDLDGDVAVEGGEGSLNGSHVDCLFYQKLAKTHSVKADSM